jgi:hypothetical protein
MKLFICTLKMFAKTTQKSHEINSKQEKQGQPKIVILV